MEKKKQLRNFKNETAENAKKILQEDPSFQEAIDKYGSMDEDALVQQLIQSVRISRQNGTYNAQQMQSYVDMISPHISEEQSEKIKNILDILNNENV